MHGENIGQISGTGLLVHVDKNKALFFQKEIKPWSYVALHTTENKSSAVKKLAPDHFPQLCLPN